MKNTNKIFLGEFIGSSFLVMVIVGSGIMAENLTNDNALRLTANTLASVLAVNLKALSFVRFSAIIPDPTITITKKLLPINSPRNILLVFFTR